MASAMLGGLIPTIAGTVFSKNKKDKVPQVESPHQAMARTRRTGQMYQNGRPIGTDAFAKERANANTFMSKTLG